MLQNMMPKRDRPKYPSVAARVSVEYKNKFDELLRHIQQTQPLVEMADLVRMLIHEDTRIPVKQEWREYLSGQRQSLPEIDDKRTALKSKAERRATA